MTLNPSTAPSTEPDANAIPAPEMPPEMQEPLAEEIPLGSKGYTGPSSFPRSLAQDDFMPIPDRWRIGFPTGYRNNVGGFGHIWDPYNQNVLKGDYPIIGNDTFMVLTGTSDTLVDARGDCPRQAASAAASRAARISLAAGGRCCSIRI